MKDDKVLSFLTVPSYISDRKVIENGRILVNHDEILTIPAASNMILSDLGHLSLRRCWSHDSDAETALRKAWDICREQYQAGSHDHESIS